MGHVPVPAHAENLSLPGRQLADCVMQYGQIVFFLQYVTASGCIFGCAGIGGDEFFFQGFGPGDMFEMIQYPVSGNRVKK